MQYFWVLYVNTKITPVLSLPYIPLILFPTLGMLGPRILVEGCRGASTLELDGLSSSWTSVSILLLYMSVTMVSSPLVVSHPHIVRLASSTNSGSVILIYSRCLLDVIFGFSRFILLLTYPSFQALGLTEWCLHLYVSHVKKGRKRIHWLDGCWGISKIHTI